MNEHQCIPLFNVNESQENLEINLRCSNGQLHTVQKEKKDLPPYWESWKLQLMWKLLLDNNWLVYYDSFYYIQVK